MTAAVPDHAQDASDVRPVVALPRKALSGPILLVIAFVAGLILFAILEGRRQSLATPAMPATTAGDIAGGSTIPPLYVPPFERRRPLEEPADLPAIDRPPLTQPETRLPPPPTGSPPPPQYPSAPNPPSQAPVPPAPRVLGGSVLVIDGARPAVTSAPGGGSAPSSMSDDGAAIRAGDRARASRLANQSTTIVQGTIMSAVLETGIDSTRPGLVRALIQYDVRSFDGTRILAPRGSRVIGEYGSEVEAGQRRAAILWTRMIRPDGVTIELGSPATDAQGRAGVRARVNTHFWQRFGDAFLQTLLDIGGQVAIDQAGSPVVVALPGAVRVGSEGRTQRPITPTMRVAPGTSVAIFVARDLDFSSIEGR